MAGFFGFFDYSKPGKGVDPDAPQKNGFFLFWELLWRKFSRFLIINLIFFVVLMPILTYIYLYFFNWAAGVLNVNPGEISTLMFQIFLSIMSVFPDWLKIGLLCLSIVLYGPLMAGVTYVFRNFAREEHAWMSDIWDKFKQNFKQGLFFGILDVLVVILVAINLPYMNASQESIGAGGAELTLLNISGYVTMFLFVIYLFARNYFYMLMVTFDLKVMQILRNSLIFSVLGIWRNILVLIINIGFFAACMLIHPLVEVITFIFIAFSFTGFVSVFTCYPVVKKFMIDRPNEKTGEDAPAKELSAADMAYIDDEYGDTDGKKDSDDE